MTDPHVKPAGDVENPSEIKFKKEFYLVVPATDHPVLRICIYLFLRVPPGTFSLFILPALTPPEYKVTVFNQKLFWSDKDFVGGKLVGISCATVNAYSSYALADRFRKAGSKVVMGGVHVNSYPQEALEHCDAVVTGEAESVWHQVVKDYENGELKKLYEGKPLEDYFSPSFDYFMKIDPKAFLLTGFIFSRGCKYYCEFCAPMAAQKVRFIKMEQAMALLERVVKAIPRPLGFKPHFLFQDNNIFSNPKYAKELFRNVIPLNINWIGNSSLDIAFDEEALKLAKESGCRMLFIGFETVNPKRFAKTSVGGVKTVEDYLKAVRKVKSYGIRVIGSFVLGFDEDTPEDYFCMIWFWIRAGFFIVALTMLTPFPGTALFDRLEKQKRILTHDWGKYDGLHHVVFQPKNWTVAQLQMWYVFMRLVGYMTSEAFLLTAGLLIIPFTLIQMQIMFHLLGFGLWR